MTSDCSLIDQNVLTKAFAGTWLAPLTNKLFQQSIELLDQRSHGDRQKWVDGISNLPALVASDTFLDQDKVGCLAAEALSATQQESLQQNLMVLHPWRKGPFNLFGIDLNTEWRSNWKWNRIQDQISPLSGRTILDVGCGNGYYLYRMLGQGARLALGIDPTQLFLAQFTALQHYLSADRAVVLPMKGEDFLCDRHSDDIEGFDTVFSMGIYYHRKNPESHLNELHRLLRSGGELVLETLVIEGDDDTELDIPGRYAQMRNVWSVPTVTRLRKQLTECGFERIRLVDLTATTVDEQRSTPWMQFDSLAQFLDPTDHQKTVEGHPAPLRVTMTASRS